jgi:hypothetical protein
VKGHNVSDDKHAAEAFSALVCIETGQWDAYLLRLFHALRTRMQTPEVRQRWVSGTMTLDEAPHFTAADVDETG